MNILFITSNRVGDSVLSTGVLSALVENYPQASFTIACGPHAADLFRGVPRLSRILVLQKRSHNMHWVSFWRQTVGTSWDLIVDLRNSLATRLLRAKKRAIRTRDTRKHKVEDNAAVLELSPAPSPRIWLTAQAEAEAEKIIGTAKMVLAVGPAANWHSKQWPIENFVQLVMKITGEDGLMAHAHVLVLADTKERAQIEPLLHAIPAEKKIELIGQNLLTVAACLKKAMLFIGNDSGLMHLAAAVGTPTLGLFGPGYEEIYGPWGKNCAVVRTIQSRDELLKRLPKRSGHHPNLMEGLSVEAVYRAAAKLLLKGM